MQCCNKSFGQDFDLTAAVLPTLYKRVTIPLILIQVAIP